MNDPSQVVVSQEPAPSDKKPPPASLRRELMAILFLYAVLSVLPFLIGMAFAP